MRAGAAEQLEKTLAEKAHEMALAIEERDLQKMAALSHQDTQKDELQQGINSLSQVRPLWLRLGGWGWGPPFESYQRDMALPLELCEHIRDAMYRRGVKLWGCTPKPNIPKPVQFLKPNFLFPDRRCRRWRRRSRTWKKRNLALLRS